MNSSKRVLPSIVILTTLTIFGVVASINLILHPVDNLVTNQVDEQKNSVAVTEPVADKIVEQGSFIASTSTISTSPSVVVTPKADQISATAYLIGNVTTGKIYLSLNQNKVLPVASMSKLMTAIVATNKFTSSTTIEITPADARVATDTSAIGVGEKFTFKEILYPLLLNSSNIAAEAISRSIIDASSTISTTTTRLAFMETMSNTAWEVGMPGAYFADPSGLDPNNRASSKDIFALARYIFKYRPDIFDITKIPHAEVATTTDHGAHSFDSTHPFVNDPRFLGGKTGRTLEAGETMLTILNIDEQPIAFIVLHSRYGYRAVDTNLLIKKYLQLHN